MSKMYTCSACHGEAMQPGSCQTEGCSMKGQPLQAMNKCDKCGKMYGMTEMHQCSM